MCWIFSSFLQTEGAEFILLSVTTLHDTNIICLIHKHGFMRLVYDTLNTGSYVCVRNVCLVNISSALVSLQVKKSHSESHVPDPSDARYAHMCLFM